MRPLAYFLPLLFVAAMSAAQSLPQQGTAALSTFLKTVTDRGDVPGVVVAVVGKDEVLYHEAFGYAQIQPQPVAMRKDSIFDVASVTKAVCTATACGICKDRTRRCRSL